MLPPCHTLLSYWDASGIAIQNWLTRYPTVDSANKLSHARFNWYLICNQLVFCCQRMCRYHACLGWLWSSWQVVCRSSRAGKLPAEVVLASPTLWLACAGKLQVKSILSTKWIRQIPSTNVLIRDVTDLDTSKDRKSSWAIPPIKFQSYRWLLRCSAVHAPRDISRFTFFSSPKVIGCYFILSFSHFILN